MCQIWCDGSFNSKTHEAGLGILIREYVQHGFKETRIHLKCKAKDNNQAELIAIYNSLQHLKHLPNDEPLFIVTDSQTAISTIQNPDNKPDKYKYYGNLIRENLTGRKWKIYHKKAHTKKQDRYSLLQAVSDRLAKGKA